MQFILACNARLLGHCSEATRVAGYATYFLVLPREGMKEAGTCRLKSELAFNLRAPESRNIQLNIKGKGGMSLYI